MHGRAIGRVAAAISVIALASQSSVAKLPPPGTPAKVSTLVAASASIESLPSSLLPSLSQLGDDDPSTYYGSAGQTCAGVTKCVWGDLKSSELVVLFGDSHAEMWLPALVPVAQEDHFKVALVWKAGCPAATVTVYDGQTKSDYTACNVFRTQMITDIDKAKPALVLTADRTSDIHGPKNGPITNATWQQGLETTLLQLQSASTKVAVIGDITIFTVNPAQCLASNAHHVQQCSVPNPNPKTTQHFAAERAAAAAEGAPYLDPQPWLCTTVCSMVIGKFGVYWDAFHVASTYAEFLSEDWANALAPLLPKS
jgi:hypothetical protein